MPIDTFAVMSELMNTWDRPEAMDFAKVMVDHVVPAYGALMEQRSYSLRLVVVEGGHPCIEETSERSLCTRGA
ncbi:hypothetical protein [Variovorax sp. efr-133-TYG-130]|uniref:hypothetical protein n=1 Tax=Variovorax sp. efr-133-TYG-130 TaxID=3040327 RepID=UPI0025548BED|nr:hypothetical protein [Variovorax sp. efr-133-TYG-130]